MKIPLRSVQVKCLDSGEGDAETFDLTHGIFVPNHGEHAGYWKSRGVSNPQRGVLRKIADARTGETLCGLYINSGDKANEGRLGLDDSGGYEISWQREEVIAIVQTTRAWQELWNPVKGPTEYVNVKQGVFPIMHKDIAKRHPDTFYLFRYPAGIGHKHPDSPPSETQLRNFWLKILAELQRRLKERGEESLELITAWQNNKVPTAGPFTLHGLRHSGLTRLVMAGVHPWIPKTVV